MMVVPSAKEAATAAPDIRDHRGRTLRRHLDAAQFGGAHAQAGIARGIAAVFAFLDRSAISRRRREQPGAQRIGHNVGKSHVGASTTSAATTGNAAETDRGHHDVSAMQFGLARQRDLAPWMPSLTEMISAPKCFSISRCDRGWLPAR